MPEILVGDIGGTNARFGIAHRDAAGHICVTDYQKYSGDNFPTLLSVIEHYLDHVGKSPSCVSLAVAGPISESRVHLTNRNWEISESDLCKLPSVEHAKLFNDFEAMARSVPELTAEDFQILHEGIADPDSPILVAGPGTGFGVGYVIPLKSGWKVLKTEGGHVAYSPQTSEETEILSILQQTNPYVSLELVASGSGLEPVHKAVCHRHNVEYAPLSPSDIKTKALKGDAVCLEVCDIRCSATLGALGDFALSGGAKGGVVIAGGVAERMIDLYTKPHLMSRFYEKGSHRDYLENIPVRLMINHLAPLIGAAALYLD
jgi:glucokinase